MQVDAKLHASLRRYAPTGTNADSVAVELPERATAADLLGTLGIPPSYAHMIVIGGQQVKPESVLEDGQRVDIFPPLAG